MPSPRRREETQLAFDIVKFVIDTKLAGGGPTRKRRLTGWHRSRSCAASKEKKQLEALEGMSEADIDAKLTELGVTFVEA